MARYEPKQEIRTCTKCGAISKKNLTYFEGKLIGFIGTLIFIEPEEDDPEDPDNFWTYAKYENTPLMLPEMKSLIKHAEKKPIRVFTEDGHLVRVEPIKAK